MFGHSLNLSVFTGLRRFEVWTSIKEKKQEIDARGILACFLKFT